MNSNTVCSIVDQILLEHGTYSPLEFLFHTGELEATAFDSWRRNRLNPLVIALISPEKSINLRLTQAADYAEALGLDKDAVDYVGTDGLALAFSSDHELDLLFRIHFRPKQDRAQLDLFFDNPAVSTANLLTEALLNHQQQTVEQHIADLRSFDSELACRFQQMSEFQQRLHQSVGAIAENLDILRYSIAPLSQETLGSRSREFLLPLWRQLSKALENHRYNNDCPDLHQSYTAIQAFDWRQVQKSIENELNWKQQSLLLFRHAEACHYLHDLTAALASWIILFIEYPDDTRQFIAKSTNIFLLKAWNEFEDTDLKFEITAFPSWLLLSNPGLARHPLPPSLHTRTETEILILAHGLASLSNSDKLSGEAIALRDRLKIAAPALFNYYMKSLEERPSIR
ncbi:MAG: hypothetical protein V3V31_15320 [Methylococcales bacterium]